MINDKQHTSLNKEIGTSVHLIQLSTYMTKNTNIVNKFYKGNKNKLSKVTYP